MFPFSNLKKERDDVDEFSGFNSVVSPFNRHALILHFSWFWGWWLNTLGCIRDNILFWRNKMLSWRVSRGLLSILLLGEWVICYEKLNKICCISILRLSGFLLLKWYTKYSFHTGWSAWVRLGRASWDWCYCVERSWSLWTTSEWVGCPWVSNPAKRRTSRNRQGGDILILIF